MTTYLLVDMANLAHRCKHVTMGDMATKAGMALHISLNAIRQSWRKFKIDHVVLCLEGRSWRKDFYPEYKANRVLNDSVRTKRERDDDEFYFNVIESFTTFLKDKTNVTVLQAQGCEADDFIARFIQIHPNDQHVILSGDSDFFQLLEDNVTMYDGVKAWTFTNKSVLDEHDNPAFSKRLMPKKGPDGKIIKDKKGQPIKETVKVMIEAPDPEYALFKKIIKGDSSDNIHGAYPGVREKGTSKSPGIIQAFEDRHGKGYNWNEFMLSEWDKVVGVDHQGNPVTAKVRVTDEFKFNKTLIDLKEQPQEIKDLLDLTIVTTIQEPPKQGVGIWFLKFCNEMDLATISKNPNEYASMLAAPYPKDTLKA